MTQPSKKSRAVRRAARALALQVLYEVDMTRHGLGETLAEHLGEAGLDDVQDRFVRDLVRGVQEHAATFDGFIQEVAPEWPVAQMAPVDRNILRMAMFELLHRPETPPRVAINEAVELARHFGSDSSRRFVNGVLGTFSTRHLPARAASEEEVEPEPEEEEEVEPEPEEEEEEAEMEWEEEASDAIVAEEDGEA